MSTKQCILVVDDDATTRAWVRFCLEQKGYRVTEASGGAAALNVARQTPPDLVLLDLHMPEGDGLEVLREVRADPSFEGVGVVVFTADARESAECDARDLGAAAFVAKPVSAEDLLTVVVGSLAPGES